MTLLPPIGRAAQVPCGPKAWREEGFLGIGAATINLIVGVFISRD